MGEQTSLLAKKLNNVKSKPIGTPRFDLINQNKKITKNYAKKFLKLNQNKNYIIYAGKIIPSDDFKLLKLINSHIEKKFKNLIIIYRPHPYGINNENYLKFNNFKEKNNLNNIILDTSLKIFEKKDLKQYIYLFSCADALISSFSTLSIEAAYYKMPVLCFAINDLLNENRFDYEVGCKYSPHLRILNKYKWPLRAFGYKQFFKNFDKLVDQSKNRKKSIDLEIIKDKIVYKDKFNYLNRLYKVINNTN